MRTPFYVSKLGAITLLSTTLWVVVLGSMTAVVGPRRMEGYVKYQVARLEADLHGGKHPARNQRVQNA
nr:hypothetical protein TQ38_27995 [Novosphingobium sp. P6W]